MPFIILRNCYEPDNLRPECFTEELCSGLVHLLSCFVGLLLWAEPAGSVTAELLCGTDLLPLLVSSWLLFFVFFKGDLLGDRENGEIPIHSKAC